MQAPFVFVVALFAPVAVFGRGTRLAWATTAQTVVAAEGEHATDVTFAVRNPSDAPVTITNITPSCGCTTVRAPARPWVLAPGATGAVAFHVDFTDKFGRLEKTIAVESSAGAQELRIILEVPVPAAQSDVERRSARAMAGADRQAVFHVGSCAACHATNASEREGAKLFASLCTPCHGSAHRAEMVPDLAIAKQPRDIAFWRKWIAGGRAGSLMPAFAQDEGGILDDEQIAAVTIYCQQHFAPQPKS